MQVHAFDKKELISSASAIGRKNYICPECLSAVRVRGGERLSRHFFHLKRNPHCRQSQKGAIHLEIQKRIQSFFEDAQMEYSFPSIGRIADVACPSSKIVYEVQYSPMSPEEAKSRIEDYAKIGYRVIWILHDHTYNKIRKAPVERFLRAFPYYYCNINEKGEGTIYDQLDRISRATPTYLKHRKPLPKFKWPEELRNRASSWPFYHKGDLLDLALQGEIFSKKRNNFLCSVKEFYLGVLHISLERSER